MESLHFQIVCDLLTRKWKWNIRLPEQTEVIVYEFEHNTLKAILNYAIQVVEYNKVDSLPNVQIKKVDNERYQWIVRDAKLIAEGNQKLSSKTQKYSVSRSTSFVVSAGYTKQMIDYLKKLVNSYDKSNN